MNLLSSNKLKAFTLCAGFFSLIGCKESSLVKPDMVPPVDGINTFQITDFEMDVNNIAVDTLITNAVSYSVVGLGRMASDPFFGQTNHGVYFQVIPPSETGGFAFPADAIIDSTVIMLPYLGKVYGDTSATNPNNALHLKAYEITQDFPFSLPEVYYYSFNRLGYNTNPVGSGTVSVSQLTDTVALANGDTVTNMLRLRADGLNQRFKSFTASQLYSFDQFLKVFRGVYIAPDTTINSNTVGYFGINNANTTYNYANAQIEVYYRSSATDTARNRAFFRFQQLTCSFFNGIYRNYTGKPVVNYLSTPTVNRDSLVMQGYPGLYSTINLKLNNRIPESVVNKAELTITALKTGMDDTYAPPSQLIIMVVQQDGYERYLSDMRNADSTIYTDGQVFVDGSCKEVIINGQAHWQYKFSFPREIQRAILAQENELKLKMMVPRNFPGSYRLIGAGPNHPIEGARLKFDVIYTKQNK